jgi:hypothetical protein
MDVHTATIRADLRAARLTPSIVVPLFASTMFLSGFLLFLVEPMAAKMVLPILGGAPMVWNGCVVFFQFVMLAGYGYSYLASRSLPLRRHVLVQACVLAAPTVVLPFMITTESVTPPTGNPLAWLMLLLAVTIGLPFFALSTSASVYQHWLSRTDHPAARDPYFLYSASNHGCLLALASYPVLIEPLLTLREQTRWWTFGYAALIALAGACGLVVWRWPAGTADPVGPAPVAEHAARSAVTAQRRIRWLALSFVPSSLMLAVTSYLSTDIAAVPLMWIVPLAIYLLTFALAFGRRAERASAIAKRALPSLVLPVALCMITNLREPLAVVLVLHLGAFGMIALNCHGDLAKDRPDASHLTEFYFWISLGGMLGGLFNTLAAPLLFHTIVEYPLVMILACLLFRTPRAAGVTPLRERAIGVAMPFIAGGLTAATLLLSTAGHLPLPVHVAGLMVPAVLGFTQRRHALRFGACVSLMLAASLAFGNPGGRVLYETRTFFGVYRVIEDPTGRYHGLAHGTTLHGVQALAPARRTEALTYFHSTGPFGQAWRTLPHASAGHEIGVIGLGVGTLATYSMPGQRWTLFEIDPAIETIARTPAYFSFMDGCGDRCRVVIGDARISLTHMPASTYDTLVLDAFSSDAIPIHLMTREALDLYLSRLVPGGALVMHISNRHLRLAPVVARLAASEGLIALQQIDVIGPTSPEGKSSSHWIVMARSKADLGALADDNRWSPLVPPDGAPVWTDDFSNILSVLSVR